MNSQFLVPAAIIAEAGMDGVGSGLTNGLINSGALGLWILWLLYRDKRDSEKRDLQHKENQEAQNAISQALRDGTTALMVAVEAMSSADTTIHELASKLKDRKLQK